MRNQWALSDRLKCPIVAQNTSLSVTLRASNDDKINTQAKRKVIQTRSEIICFSTFFLYSTKQSNQDSPDKVLVTCKNSFTYPGCNLWDQKHHVCIHWHWNKRQFWRYWIKLQTNMQTTHSSTVCTAQCIINSDVKILNQILGAMIMMMGSH